MAKRGRTDKDLLPGFEGILDKNEKLLWSEKPELLPFILGHMGIFVPMLPMIMIGFLMVLTKSNHDTAPISFRYFGYPLESLVIMGAIASMLVLTPLFAWLGHKNAFYGISNRRFLIRSGFLGTDFTSIDYDKVVETTVDVGPIDSLLGVGKLRINTGAVGSKGTPILHSFLGLRDPYNVFKLAKKTTMDIKSDIHYPNAKRPKNNPGYKTTYKG